jgi:hypothetical protein
MAFTGIRDVDLEILSKLDDSELGKMCGTDKYFRNLCKNDDFWRNRTIKRFGKYLGTVEEINEYRKKAKIPTWRLYYISLVDFIEQELYPQNYPSKFGKINRKDFNILTRYINENDEKFESEVLENFKEGKWKKILQEELFNPNKFLYISEIYGENEENGKEYVEYLLNLKDKRIDINNAFYRLLYFDDENEEDEIIKKYLNDPRAKVDKVINAVISILKENDFDEQRERLHNLNIYLDYIKEKNRINSLEEKIEIEDDKIDSETLLYIYDYLGINKNTLSKYTSF